MASTINVSFSTGNTDSLALTSGVPSTNIYFIAGGASAINTVVQTSPFGVVSTTLNFVEYCIPDNPVYVRWINDLGGWEYNMFSAGNETQKIVVGDVFNPLYAERIDSVRTASHVNLGVTETVLIAVAQVELWELDFIRTIAISPNIQIWNVERSAWEGAIIDGNVNSSINRSSTRGDLSFTLRRIDQDIQF